MDCRKIFLPWLFLFFSTVLSAQIAIEGRILDVKTGAPIPFASVGIMELRKGTSSNSDGEFIIKVDSLPVKLTFAHISYVKQDVMVSDTIPLEIRLKSGEIVLKEITIKDKEDPDYAYNILINAYAKAGSNANKSKYGKAYYRQVSRVDDDYSELYEVFFDTRFSSQGITDWAVQEGRYAMKTGRKTIDYVYNKNFTLMMRIFTMFQPETDKFLMPVNRNVRENYNVDVHGIRNIEGNQAVLIRFVKKENITMPIMEGEILVDIKTFDIYKISGKIIHDKFDVIELSNPIGFWKNYQIGFEAAYKKEGQELLLDYITIEQNFDYYVDNVFRHKDATKSFLTYYEYYTPDRSKNLGGKIIRFGASDRDILNEIGYNKYFWEENPIVKRTPVENEIIASFEASRAFGSIYLNEREQLQLENYDIDADPFVQQVTTAIKSTRIATRGEKIYLHLDKPFYTSGETIWFSTYLVNASTHIPALTSGVIYVDLVDPEGNIAASCIIKHDQQWKEGNIEIPSSLLTGIYRIRAYTNWMKNTPDEYFFDSPLNIYQADEILSGNYPQADVYEEYDITFFPEGGNSVAGIPGLIGFKAIDVAGNGIAVKGKVIDDLGKQVAIFETRHDGMGSFFIMPNAERKYTAVVEYLNEEKKVPLPEAMPEGLTLSVNNLKNNVIQVIIKCTSGFNNREVYLIGQSRGIIYHKEKLLINKGGAITLIPKSKIPPGIFQITLFDSAHVPRCERLVFLKPPNEIIVNLTADTESPGYRDPVNLSLILKDQFGKPVRNATLSVSITDASLVGREKFAENIETYLLMGSDLPGKIANPGFYFKDNDRETLLALDLVMITHGWRRFIWNEILNSPAAKNSYHAEYGINLSGTATKGNSSEPLRNSYLNLISADLNRPGYWATSTTQSGSFRFYDIDIPDSLWVIVQPLDENGKIVDAGIKFNPIETFLVSSMEYQKYPAVLNDMAIKYIENEKQVKLLASGISEGKRIMLKEVVVKTKKYDPGIYGEADFVYKPGNEIYAFTDIFQMMQGRLAGVNVTGSGMNTQVTMRGVSSIMAGNTPLFLLDGMPISASRNVSSSQGSESGGTPGRTIMVGGRPIIIPAQGGQETDQPAQGSGGSEVNSILLTINPRDVDRIEVLKNPGTTAAFGVRGSNGVIAIYTNRGTSVFEPQVNSKYHDYFLQGFSPVREFYVPKYSVGQEQAVQPDKRSLLFWEPRLIPGPDGVIHISFYNSDIAKKLQIIVEGITGYGETIFLNNTIGAEPAK